MGTKEEQTTPVTDLDVVMREGMDVFEGVSVSGEPEKTDEDIITGPANKGKETEAPLPDADKGKTTEEAVGKTAGTGVTQEPDFRFKTQEEAEKGYKQLQAEKTRAELRAKAVEDELIAIRTAETQKKDKAAADSSFVEFAATRRQKELDEIDELDPDDPDYRKKVAQCRATADRDIRDYTYPAAAAPVTAPVKAADQGEENASAYVRSTITEKGLPERDPLFWHFAQSAPEQDEKGNALPLDDQIAWALNERNNYLSHANPGEKERVIDDAKAKAGALSGREMPLGRTGAERRPDDTGDDRPVSLGDALDAATNMRRL